jgi:hypothetical protein
MIQPVESLEITVLVDNGTDTPPGPVLRLPVNSPARRAGGR